MNTKLKLILLTISMFTISCILTVAVSAWLTDTGSDQVIAQLGDLDSSIIVYKGQDFDYNGTLDQFEETDPVRLFALQYQELTREDLNEVKYLYAGRKITFKVIVTNTGDIDGAVSLRLNLNDDEDTIALSKMFAYTDISYQVFEKDDIQDNLYLIDETQATKVNDVYAYDYDGYFVKDVQISTTQLVVIDFQLSCIESGYAISLSNGEVTYDDYLASVAKIQASENRVLILKVNEFEIVTAQADYVLN